MQVPGVIVAVVSCLTLAILTCTANATVVMPAPVECELDDDLTSLPLERCRRRGERFLLKYLSAVRDEVPWNKCSSFAEFGDCMRTLQERCGSMTHALNGDWLTQIHDVMKCACHGSTECRRDAQCFEQEYKGVLALRCDDYYKFNIKQHTQRKCHFIRERIWCKEALVTSACGARVGQFAFHVFRQQSNDYLSRRSCDVSRDAPYSGFHYTEQCSPEVPVRMAQCKAMFLTRTRLRFKDESDLVATGRHIRKKMNIACRDFFRYQECVKPLEDDCSQVIDLIKDYDGRSLRTYLLKMDYICQKKRKEYSLHLECFQNVLEQQQQRQHCQHIWDALKPMLRVESSHTFYCRPASNHSTHIHSMLHKLTRCYHDVFRDSCGEDGGNTMNGLMMQAFQDPVYLRFRFRPDCDLHSDHRNQVLLGPHKVRPSPTVTVSTPSSHVSVATYSPHVSNGTSTHNNLNLFIFVWTLLMTLNTIQSCL